MNIRYYCELHILLMSFYSVTFQDRFYTAKLSNWNDVKEELFVSKISYYGNA